MANLPQFPAGQLDERFLTASKFGLTAHWLAPPKRGRSEHAPALHPEQDRDEETESPPSRRAGGSWPRRSAAGRAGPSAINDGTSLIRNMMWVPPPGPSGRARRLLGLRAPIPEGLCLLPSPRPASLHRQGRPERTARHRPPPSRPARPGRHDLRRSRRRSASDRSSRGGRMASPGRC